MDKHHKHNLLLISFVGLLLGLLVIKYQNAKENPFEEHPIILIFIVIALAMWFSVDQFKEEYPGLYQRYLCDVPLGVDFFRFLVVSFLISLLLPKFVPPLVCLFLLLVATGKTLF